MTEMSEHNSATNRLFQIIVSLMLISGGGITGFVVWRQNDNVERVSILETNTAVLQAQREAEVVADVVTASTDIATDSRIDARLISLESKLDARLGRIEDKLDGVRDRMAGVMTKTIP